MRLIDIINAPWAIRPTMLEEVQRIYATHLRGDKLDLAAVEAAVGRKLDNSVNGSYVIDNVAVIPLIGVIGKRMNLFTEISGGVSTEIVAGDFTAAINDPAIKGIVLHIDSPGGTVDGTKTLADLIANARGSKPVIACADGMMCSAAYWIGAAADSVYISDTTTDVGSIGVVCSHVDVSRLQEMAGVKTTEITAGKFKRVISQYQPLSEEGRTILQGEVDDIYQMFTESVAANRGRSVDQVKEEMADGRTFLGVKAIEAGLVDGVASLSDCIQQVLDLSRTPTTVSKGRRAGVAPANFATQENLPMLTLEQLKAERPDLVEALAAELSSGHAEALAAARTEGAAAEQARITGVRAVAIPGHEALVEAMAFDGHSTAADAALAIVNAEQTQRAAAVTQTAADANEPVPSDDTTAAAKTMKRADFDALDQNGRRAFLSAGGKLVA